MIQIGLAMLVTNVVLFVLVRARKAQRKRTRRYFALTQKQLQDFQDFYQNHHERPSL